MAGRSGNSPDGHLRLCLSYARSFLLSSLLISWYKKPDRKGCESAPSKDELITLGAVVLIRTILGYFLSKETNQVDVE
jgi:uncharacterized membrane protein